MKKLVTLCLILMVFMLSLMFHNEIISFIIDNFADLERNHTVLKNNQYAKNDDYKFVQITDNFSPANMQDIINIYYTVLNSGMSEFTFYCPTSYKECIDDVNYLSNNQLLLSNINNFIPIYNSFSNIETEFDTLGKVTISIKHSYQDSEIEEIQEVVNKIISDNITDDMTVEDKIKVIHDYIINNTKYDINRSDNKINNYHSDTAYGALIEHYAICGGYADSMKLFLDYFLVPNYKISSENHIWNLVYLNDNWYHLDLTWDDPVTSSGEDVLEYDYFLISTEELKEIENEQHIFDSTIYQEAI